MPPKKPPAKPSAQQSKSQALVTTGPKEVVHKKTHSKRDADGHKPTTARALVLRNGKYGSMGTGEVILATKMSGREKLELLAGMKMHIVARKGECSSSAQRGFGRELRTGFSDAFQCPEGYENCRGSVHRYAIYETRLHPAYRVLTQRGWMKFRILKILSFFIIRSSQRRRLVSHSCLQSPARRSSNARIL